MVDGMSEFHGYIHGVPTTLLGYNTSPPALRHYLRRLLVTGSTEIRPDLVINGQKEALEGTVIVRDMKTYSQEIIKIENLTEYLKKLK